MEHGMHAEDDAVMDMKPGMLMTMAREVLSGFKSLKLPAEDLVGIVLQRYLRMTKGSDEEKLRSYWHTAMVNVSIELSKRSAKRPEVEQKHEQRMPKRAEPTPLIQAMQNELLEMIEQNCSAEEWAVLRMYHLEGYTMIEIAETLEMSKTTVSRRMHAAIRRARMVFGEVPR